MAQPEQSTFVMYSAREAVAGGMTYITSQVKALEDAVFNDPGLAFDLSKTVVESTCKTIIIERGGTVGPNDNLPTLFRNVAQSVPFLPAASSGDAAARTSLLKTLSGMSTALQGVCELRNAHGSISHGSARSRSTLERAQATLAAQAADSIIGFLFRVHKQSLTHNQKPPITYMDNPEFNDWIDRQCEPVKILNFDPYNSSEVLFAVDPQAYKTAFAEYVTQEVEIQEEIPDSPGEKEVPK